MPKLVYYLKFASTLVSLVITETKLNFISYYQNRPVLLYKTIFTKVLKLCLPNDCIYQTELNKLTECAAGV